MCAAAAGKTCCVKTGQVVKCKMCSLLMLLRGKS
jgi:hypothetical protein